MFWLKKKESYCKEVWLIHLSFHKRLLSKRNGLLFWAARRNEGAIQGRRAEYSKGNLLGRFRVCVASAELRIQGWPRWLLILCSYGSTGMHTKTGDGPLPVTVEAQLCSTQPQGCCSQAYDKSDAPRSSAAQWSHPYICDTQQETTQMSREKSSSSPRNINSIKTQVIQDIFMLKWRWLCFVYVHGIRYDSHQWTSWTSKKLHAFSGPLGVTFLYPRISLCWEGDICETSIYSLTYRG